MGVAFVVVVVDDEAVVAAFCAGQKCSPAQPHATPARHQSDTLGLTNPGALLLPVSARVPDSVFFANHKELKCSRPIRL